MKVENRTYCLLGYSGHSYVVADSILSSGGKIIGYFDFREASKNLYNLKYLGLETEISSVDCIIDHILFPTVGDSKIRASMISRIESAGFRQGVVSHQSSIVSSSSSIGLSTFIGPGAIINSYVKVGVGSIINSGSIIEHECDIGNFSHVAPGAVLAGNVSVGNNTFIGANSIIKQGVKISNNVIIGAGSVVLTDIPEGETWVGNPSKKIK